MVEDIIKDLRLPVKQIKDEYLPFKDAEWQKDLTRESVETYPKQYLKDEDS
jgi:hypothetical protein